MSGFWSAVGGALVISLVSMIFNTWLMDRRSVESVTVERRPLTIINPDD